ncbi:MAG: RNA polymerase sigma factor [Bacteroidota bacterium]
MHDRFERFCRARAYADMPAEDLMNETLLIAYSKIDQLQNKGAFLSFLIGISRRILANKKRKQQPIIPKQELPMEIIGKSYDPVQQKNTVAFLHFGLAQLPEAQREALILFEITGFSIKEISEIQQSSTSAVKQRLARGRKALAEIVKKELQNSTTNVGS